MKVYFYCTAEKAKNSHMIEQEKHSETLVIYCEHLNTHAH